MKHNKLVIGISGASGVIYGVKLLEVLCELGVEVHLIITKAARLTISYEITSRALKDIISLASVYYYDNRNIAADICSGSVLHDGMIIAPCSIKTMSEIAYGLSSSLLTRAADVTLKERRRLVLMVRESPLNLCHIESMMLLTKMGAIIAPPVNAFYNNPQSIDDLVYHTIGRVLDLFGLHNVVSSRWRQHTTSVGGGMLSI